MLNNINLCLENVNYIILIHLQLYSYELLFVQLTLILIPFKICFSICFIFFKQCNFILYDIRLGTAVVKGFILTIHLK